MCIAAFGGRAEDRKISARPFYGPAEDTVPVLLTPALWLPAQAMAMPQEAAVDLALGYCLHSEGRATQMQSYRFVQALGAKQGWPSGWYQQIRPNQIQAAINNAGGCGRLLQRLPAR